MKIIAYKIDPYNGGSLALKEVTEDGATIIATTERAGFTRDDLKAMLKSNAEMAQLQVRACGEYAA